jgi:uncharacterized membrane protein
MSGSTAEPARPKRGGHRRLRAILKAPIGKISEHLRTSWWITPSLCVLVAILLAHIAKRIDDHVESDATAWYLFEGGAEGARQVLSTIASSMMTFTGVVFSVTVLVLQLASSQFSPRVLRTFLKDQPAQLALGTFVGTFVYALFGLRSVRGKTDEIDLNVPSFTVWFAVLLALLCVGAFIGYIHHVAQSIRAVVVIRRIADETRSAMKRLYPEGIGDELEEQDMPAFQGPVTLLVLHRGSSGVLSDVHADELVSSAREARVVLRLLPCVGDFVAQGSPLFEVRGGAEKLDIRVATSALVVNSERDISNDVAFGFRELVDVAERALSPSTNDPTTAIQVLDEIHDLLLRLARRRFPDPARRSEDGELLVYLPRLDFDDFVRLALDEIRQYGANSIQVLRRLRFLVEDLSRIAPPWRRAELAIQLALLDAAAKRAFPDASDQVQALHPSPQGHGPH